MIVLADSGSTKTDWAFFSADSCRIQSTQGINPFFLDKQGLTTILNQELVPVEQVDAVYFYGAGCSSATQHSWLKECIATYFRCNQVFVYSDLLGAARSLCQHTEGIACILGTGSNSCYYNGKDIVENRPSLGYIFGDEGGGSALGRQFIQAYLRGQLPLSIKEKFDATFQLSVAEIVYTVYKKPFPNRFLASFTRFIRECQQEEYIYQLIRKNFEDFFVFQILHYSKSVQLPMYCVGSIGVAFEPVLRQVASQFGITLSHVIQSPLEGLLTYHNS